MCAIALLLTCCYMVNGLLPVGVQSITDIFVSLTHVLSLHHPSYNVIRHLEA